MPPAKKHKTGAAAKAKASSNETARPPATELEGASGFAQLAKTHWLKSSKRAAKVKVKNNVIKGEIWDVLEKEGFALKSLLALEGLQILER